MLSCGHIEDLWWNQDLQTVNLISHYVQLNIIRKVKWCGGCYHEGCLSHSVCVSRSPASDFRVMQKKRYQPHIIYHMRNEDPQMHNMFISTDRGRDSQGFDCEFRIQLGLPRYFCIPKACIQVFELDSCRAAIRALRRRFPDLVSSVSESVS